MTKPLFTGSTAVLILAGMAVAQTTTAPRVVYQQAGAIGATFGPVETGNMAFFSQTIDAKPVTGSPYSATEEHRSLQVLADGTRIEHSDVSQVSRDAEGRTRREAPHAPGDQPPFITIDDPVAGAHYMLNPAKLTASKLPEMKAGMMAKNVAEGIATAQRTSMAVTTTSSMVMKESVGGATGSQNVMIMRAEGTAPKSVETDLGFQSINGVTAGGKRTTMTIEVGAMGNDRPILVTSERWFSNDLQTLVRTRNSDPRFGDTIFELTNITRTAPDASLFQVPGGYTITEGKQMMMPAPIMAVPAMPIK